MNLKKAYEIVEGCHCVNDGDCAYDCDLCKKAMDKFKEYANLEEQGLLFKLPCKIGSIAYSIEEGEVKEFKIKSLSHIEKLLEFERFNETVFLTQKEAENKLAELKNDEI